MRSERESWSVMKVLSSHLRELAPESFDRTHQVWKPDERNLNAALAIVHGAGPRTSSTRCSAHRLSRSMDAYEGK